MFANDYERERFVMIIGGLCETFGRAPTKATYYGYELGLSDLPFARIEQAAAKALTQCKHMPNVRQLRDLAGEMAPEERGILAWEVLSKTVAGLGAYSTVDFDDKAINAAIKNLGGWEYICELGTDEFEKWFRQRFISTYEAYDGRPLSEEQAAPCLGIFGKQNGNSDRDRLKELERRGVYTGLPVAIACHTAPPSTPALPPSNHTRADVPRLTLKKA